MGKRSGFPRLRRDLYPTPAAAVKPLLPHLKSCERFVEPCAGKGDLIRHLETAGHRCVGAFDIVHRGGCGVRIRDARTLHVDGRIVSAYITNPPWDRDVLHAIIANLSEQRRTWLLIDADWMHTIQAAPYWRICSLIVSIGRVKWFPNSPHVGKDNCCWYRFDPDHRKGPRLIFRAGIAT